MLTADELPEGYKNLPAVCERLGLWIYVSKNGPVSIGKDGDTLLMAFPAYDSFRWVSKPPYYADSRGDGTTIEAALLRRFAPAPQQADEPYVAMLAKVAALECRVAELEAKATTKAQADGFDVPIMKGGYIALIGAGGVELPVTAGAKFVVDEHGIASYASPDGFETAYCFPAETVGRFNEVLIKDGTVFGPGVELQLSNVDPRDTITLVDDLDSAEIKVDQAGELPEDHCLPTGECFMCGMTGGHEADCVLMEENHHASIAEAVIAADGPGVGDVAYARQQMQHALDILDGKSVPQWSRDRIEYARKAIADALRGAGSQTVKYPTLPVMQCDPDCGECCGPVMCRQIEFEAIANHVTKNGIVPVAQGLTCPLYQGGQCTVYEVRPMICRAFGHCEQLCCSRGYNVNMGSREKRETLDRYEQSLLSETPRHLHELLPDGFDYLLSAMKST